MCGNYASTGPQAGAFLGSPPRVRELRLKLAGLFSGLRITPACAGITRPAGPFPDAPGDHPRVCGNYPGGQGVGQVNWGSPPRVRELLMVILFAPLANGITPACAGITVIKSLFILSPCGSPPRVRELLIASCPPDRQCPDHPRVCGNYSFFLFAPSLTLGSRPRVRELLSEPPADA